MGVDESRRVLDHRVRARGQDIRAVLTYRLRVADLSCRLLHDEIDSRAAHGNSDAGPNMQLVARLFLPAGGARVRPTLGLTHSLGLARGNFAPYKSSSRVGRARKIKCLAQSTWLGFLLSGARVGAV